MWCLWRTLLTVSVAVVGVGATSQKDTKDREQKPWKYYPWRAQFQQDRKLAEHVFRNKKDGYFIELGAVDGLEFSNTFAFEAARNWSGVLIDFFEDPKCQVNRPLSKCLAACVAGVEGTRSMYADGLLSGLATFKDDNDTSKRDVKCTTLPKLLQQNKAPQHIDWLSLDVEGAELEILEPLLRSNFLIDVITIETRMENKINYTKFMVNKGYYFLDRFGMDNAFVKEWTDEETFCNEGMTSLRQMLHGVLDMVTSEENLLESLNRHKRNSSVLRLNRTAEVVRRFGTCKMAVVSLHLARSLFLRKENFLQEACVGTAFEGRSILWRTQPAHFDKCGPFFALSLSRMRFINAVQSDWPIFRLLYVFSQKASLLCDRSRILAFRSECSGLGFEPKTFELGRTPGDLRLQGMVCGLLHNAIRWLHRAKSDGPEEPKRK